MIDWLTSTLIATSALMALVLLVRNPVRRLFGAGVAYALWLLPAARAVLPSFTETVERAALQSSAYTAFPAPSFAASGAVSSQPAIDLVALLLAVWIAGAVGMLGRGLWTYRKQRRGILEGAVQLAQLDGIRILRSERVRGPLAFGIIDRVIILPLDFDQKFTEPPALPRARARACAPSLRRPCRQSLCLRPALPPVVQPACLGCAFRLSLRPGSGVRCPGAGQGPTRRTRVLRGRARQGREWPDLVVLRRARSAIHLVTEADHHDCECIDTNPQDWLHIGRRGPATRFAADRFARD